MKLHGHTRLELTDIHTGAVEVVEKDNIITNAVGEIFNGYGEFVAGLYEGLRGERLWA